MRLFFRAKQQDTAHDGCKVEGPDPSASSTLLICSNADAEKGSDANAGSSNDAVEADIASDVIPLVSQGFDLEADVVPTLPDAEPSVIADAAVNDDAEAATREERASAAEVETQLQRLLCTLRSTNSHISKANADIKRALSQRQPRDEAAGSSNDGVAELTSLKQSSLQLSSSEAQQACTVQAESASTGLLDSTDDPSKSSLPSAEPAGGPCPSTRPDDAVSEVPVSKAGKPLEDAQSEAPASKSRTLALKPLAPLSSKRRNLQEVSGKRASSCSELGKRASGHTEKREDKSQSVASPPVAAHFLQVAPASQQLTHEPSESAMSPCRSIPAGLDVQSHESSPQGQKLSSASRPQEPSVDVRGVSPSRGRAQSPRRAWTVSQLTPPARSQSPSAFDSSGSLTTANGGSLLSLSTASCTGLPVGPVTQGQLVLQHTSILAACPPRALSCRATLGVSTTNMVSRSSSLPSQPQQPSITSPRSVASLATVSTTPFAGSLVVAPGVARSTSGTPQPPSTPQRGAAPAPPPPVTIAVAGSRSDLAATSSGRFVCVSPMPTASPGGSHVAAWPGADVSESPAATIARMTSLPRQVSSPASMAVAAVAAAAAAARAAPATPRGGAAALSASSTSVLGEARAAWTPRQQSPRPTVSSAAAPPPASSAAAAAKVDTSGRWRREGPSLTGRQLSPVSVGRQLSPSPMGSLTLPPSAAALQLSQRARSPSAPTVRAPSPTPVMAAAASHAQASAQAPADSVSGVRCLGEHFSPQVASVPCRGKAGSSAQAQRRSGGVGVGAAAQAAARAAASLAAANAAASQAAPAASTTASGVGRGNAAAAIAPTAAAPPPTSNTRGKSGSCHGRSGRALRMEAKDWGPLRRSQGRVQEAYATPKEVLHYLLENSADKKLSL
eukprot:TRINITY_DN26528_c0_g1_i2.p1 TRINITY_DN26528_c0_g1~~TRINITY_DN26528_c0_g1_i2.p1  ORF type:complete len:901 (+),score=154.49 TRINITY_DN26528_c0_g1_i2:102-2804(+)